MTLDDALISVWRQVLVDDRPQVELDGKVHKVIYLRAKKLRLVEFDFNDFRRAGIEQNPKTTSRWAELARDGKRIMQFRSQGRYIANVCEG
ncbi:MAG TPA: hypothetical protein VG028_16160 [Terriglobia bacterium]|nr:hypothetical protein [Terriglobia bacterium]